MRELLWVLLLLVAVPAWSQSITTDGNIESDAQLVSKVATGTAPLAVSSTTMVPSLNADQVDGIEGAALALDADLQSAEAMLVALQAQVDALGLALVPRTGQTTCYDVAGAVTTCGTGIGLAQDGDLELGVTWPNPRFTKNGDGTVTDNLTGLIWLEDANCAAAMMDWEDALGFANTLFDGSVAHNGGDCGLSDGSAVGAWRLPNVRELQSLVHYGVSAPAVPNTAGTGKWTEGDPFSGVQLALYWPSTRLRRHHQQDRHPSSLAGSRRTITG
jgi:hypothetical protein